MDNGQVEIDSDIPLRVMVLAATGEIMVGNFYGYFFWFVTKLKCSIFGGKCSVVDDNVCLLL